MGFATVPVPFYIGLNMRVPLFVENLFATLKQMIKLTRLEQLIADRAVTTGGGQTPYFISVEEVISCTPDDEDILLVADSHNQKLRLVDMN